MANQQTFTTFGVIFKSAVKEGIRLSAPVSGSYVYVGINNSAPVHTLDIVNRVSTVNVLNIKNAAASSTIFTVTDEGNTTISGTLTVTGITTHTGAITLSLTGSNTVLTVGRMAYSASTVQAALALPSTPVFTGNITLPTLSVVPTGYQLGYIYLQVKPTIYTYIGAAQVGLAPLAKTNLAYGILMPSVYLIMGTMHFSTPETGIAFTQIVTAISKTSQAYDSESVGFVRTYGSGNGGTTGQVYSQQVQRVLTCTTSTEIWLVGTVSATFMTTWSIPDQKCNMHVLRIA